MMTVLEGAATHTMEHSELDGRYQICGFLGDGGFGVVYRAKQISTGQTVALKLLRNVAVENRSEATAGFLRELELCAGLYHPNIVRLIDSGSLPKDCWYGVFEFVPGETLAQLLHRQSCLIPSAAADIMGQVLDGLACAHKGGVVHRDLKPANIMVGQTGARLNAKILDFGIGTYSSTAHREQFLSCDRVSKIVGTPSYMSPEQVGQGSMTPASDLYSWGLVMLECLSGHPVVRGSSVAEVLYHHLGPAEVALPEYLADHPLGALLRSVLRKKAEMRLGDAVQALAQLETVDMADLDARWRDCVPREGMSDGDGEASVSELASHGLRTGPVGDPSCTANLRTATELQDPTPAPSEGLLVELEQHRERNVRQKARLEIMRELSRLVRGYDGRALDEPLAALTEKAAYLMVVSRASVWVLAGDELRCLKLYDSERNVHEDGARLTASQFPA
ncbi:MAG: serine/threonine-protein kinase [Nannocystaceae bacterium]